VVKKNGEKTFVITDAAMNDLLRTNIIVKDLRGVQPETAGLLFRHCNHFCTHSMKTLHREQVMTKSSNIVPVIDVDDPSTWPNHIHRVVSQWAERCRGTTEYVLDLPPLSLDEEKTFRKLFDGYLLRA